MVCDRCSSLYPLLALLRPLFALLMYILVHCGSFYRSSYKSARMLGIFLVGVLVRNIVCIDILDPVVYVASGYLF